MAKTPAGLIDPAEAEKKAAATNAQEGRGVVLYVFSNDVAVGDLVLSEPELIRALAHAGDVDPHPDAIAAAEAAGAKTVRV
jgi:hypothetical protein